MKSSEHGRIHLFKFRNYSLDQYVLLTPTAKLQFFLTSKIFLIFSGVTNPTGGVPYGCQAYMQQLIQPTDLGGAYAHYSITGIQMPTMSPPTT